MTTADQVIWTAATQLGMVESPAGSNRQPYGRWYGLNGVQWCAIFNAWTMAHAGWGDPREVFGLGPQGWQYCPAILRDMRTRGLLVAPYAVRRGDGLLFNWPGGDPSEHFGLCEVNNGTSVVAIEGNTSLSSNSNGGQVMRRGRSYGVIAAGIRFAYDSAPAPAPTPAPPVVVPAPPPPPPDWAALRVALAKDLLPKMMSVPDLYPGVNNPVGVWVLQQTLNLVAGGGLVVDSAYGPATATAVGNVQKLFGLDQTPLVAGAQVRFTLVKLLERAAAGD